MKRLILTLFSVLGFAVCGNAQATDNAVLTAPLKWNWYVQTGLDISLQKPYSYEFSDAFKEGAAWGLGASLGRWFTPEIGLRVRLNWQNGIPLFGWNKANWIAPFYDPGKNMKRGGYIVGRAGMGVQRRDRPPVRRLPPPDVAVKPSVLARSSKLGICSR